MKSFPSPQMDVYEHVPLRRRVYPVEQVLQLEELEQPEQFDMQGLQVFVEESRKNDELQIILQFGETNEYPVMQDVQTVEEEQAEQPVGQGKQVLVAEFL